ncbi:MAG: thioredoxin [Thermaerobacter sp.]|nr:thioredoxin [Thermaerobacter sp.]
MGATTVGSVSENTFATEVLGADRPVLVDFWAEWCGPCRMVSPVVEDLAGEFGERLKVVKLNVDENPQIASQYGIMSIPTLAVFADGRLKDRLVGYRPKNQLRQELERSIS